MLNERGILVQTVTPSDKTSSSMYVVCSHFSIFPSLDSIKLHFSNNINISGRSFM